MNSVFKVGAQFLKFGLFIFNTMGHEKRKNLIFLVIHLYIFLFFGCSVFLLLRAGFSPVAESGGDSSLRRSGFHCSGFFCVGHRLQ